MGSYDDHLVKLISSEALSAFQRERDRCERDSPEWHRFVHLIGEANKLFIQAERAVDGHRETEVD